MHVPLRWLVVAVLVVVAGALGWLGWKVVESNHRDAIAAQAVESAKKYALILSNIDTGTIDKNFTEIYNSSTKEFNDTHAIQAAELRRQFIEKKVSAHGSVAKASATFVETSKVTVELLVDESVSNADLPQAQDMQIHITMTLEKVEGQWLISDLKAA